VKIGIRTLCLGRDLKGVLQQCEELGLDGIQVSPQELPPERLSAADRAAFRRDVERRGLEISAVSGGPNLVDPRVAAESVERFQAFLQLSVDLGPGIVTAEVKAKPPDLDDDTAWQTCLASVRAIAAHAGQIGAIYAVEAGPHCLVRTVDDLQRLREAVDSEHLRINYDPANLYSAGCDVVAGVAQVGPWIVHTHARDARRHEDGTWTETPLGHGDVDWLAYLKALDRAGFDGYLCIEREQGSNRFKDAWHARERLLAALKKVEEMEEEEESEGGGGEEEEKENEEI
jgi:sugar phosphate isomerase/epimerase